MNRNDVPEIKQQKKKDIFCNFRPIVTNRIKKNGVLESDVVFFSIAFYTFAPLRVEKIPSGFSPGKKESEQTRITDVCFPNNRKSSASYRLRH